VVILGGAYIGRKVALVHRAFQGFPPVLERQQCVGAHGVGDARKIGKEGSAFMQVHVDRTGDNTSTVAHYYKHNGDMVLDPDMEFLYIPEADAWLPMSTTQWTGHKRALEMADGAIKGFYPRELTDQCRFTNMWMQNIKSQQGGLKALRVAA